MDFKNLFLDQEKFFLYLYASISGLLFLLSLQYVLRKEKIPQSPVKKNHILKNYGLKKLDSPFTMKLRSDSKKNRLNQSLSDQTKDSSQESDKKIQKTLDKCSKFSKQKLQ